jgi:malate dehydrogenase (oxaloacetate-decarboxylating)(NADP+)
MMASMADRPVIFAMANPDPEIRPEEVRAVRDDALIATGRSDYDNQVNNVLGFPFIFRGALDVRARAINEEMKMAATRALAELAREDVPEAVAAAYGEDRIHFGPRYLIPKPFDSRVLLWVAPAVAEAAMESGVARKEVDLEEYRVELEGRLGPAREFMRMIIDRAKAHPKRIVFPEGENRRVIRASAVIREESFGTPVLLGNRDRIRELADEEEVELDGVEVLDPERSERHEEYARRFWRKRQRKGVTRSEADWHMNETGYFGAMMVESGDADAFIAGANQYYADALRPPLRTIGTRPERDRVSGLYIMVFEEELYFFTDTTVNIDPSPGDLAEVAAEAADFVQRLGIVPRVAMLSFSNFGSARHEAARKVRRATRLVKERRPDLTVDGEMQADTAVVEEIITETYPFSELDGPANVLVFPDLSAANICYKLMSRLGGAEAIGPVLLGAARPVHILQRGATVAEIVNLAALSVVDAETRRRTPPEGS